MKGMQKIVHGEGFRGVLNYVSDRDSPESERGRLVGGNMSGTTPRELAKEFGAIRNLRPDIAKPVWHQSLRLPKSDKLDDAEWSKFADDYMQRMGFSDDHARTYWLHDDADGQHIHIVACRVSLSGQVHDSSHQSMKSTPILSAMESEYKLTVTPGVKLDDDGNIIKPAIAKPKKGELEQALRTGEEPPRQRLQRIVAAAKQDRPTVMQFVERLEAAGVTPIANLASTGRLNGFTFKIDGIPFKGSQLGKAYGWGQLSKEVEYEQTRDSAELKRYSAERSSSPDGPRTAENHRGIRPAPTDAEVVRYDGGQDGAVVADPGQSDGREPSRDIQGRQSGEQGSIDAGAGQQAPGQSNQAIGNDLTPDVGNGQGIGQSQAPQHMATSLDYSPSDAGAYDRVVDLGGAFVNNPAQQAKFDAWRQQHAALQAPGYRLTLTARRDDLSTYNLGKGKGDDGLEKVYSAQDVAAKIPWLSRQNARGYDIYITPIDPKHHYLVVDDMTGLKRGVLERSGYQPCLVQSSSNDNYQAVLKAPRQADLKDEQSNANRLVQHINQEVGDPKFSGVIHPFRMAGFSNKKPGRDNAFTRIVAAGHRICSKAKQALDDMRAAVVARQKAAQDAKDQTLAQESKRLENVRMDALNGTDGNHQDKLAREAYKSVFAQVQGAGWELDLSKADFRVARLLLNRGLSGGTVEGLLIEHSPNLHERHGNAPDYARRTVEAAIEKNALEAKPQAPKPPVVETQAQRIQREQSEQLQHRLASQRQAVASTITRPKY